MCILTKRFLIYHKTVMAAYFNWSYIGEMLTDNGVDKNHIIHQNSKYTTLIDIKQHLNKQYVLYLHISKHFSAHQRTNILML